MFGLNILGKWLKATLNKVAEGITWLSDKLFLDGEWHDKPIDNKKKLDIVYKKENKMNTKLDEKVEQKVSHLKMWHVILMNTDHHTFEFVVKLLMTIFNKDFDEACALTQAIHKQGQAICETTHKERAELLQEKVKGYGADPNMKGKPYPLPCFIEPTE
jgi:ATP-dependent Clp protease adaptor protein ClpS